ncbi:pyruvate dehydrogenase phosphatase regulatory subunit, mitochondrial-like [Tigriopus californicus]|uniref:pyruvate dehydrogenase phosphatase regulatory subunit, mitochondrial-like n=1 Tax=Tigriopus californicus TaxID=6832 RepID=UPI0027DA7A40|nr:pyruvate dehydrogenase phosphatase regulatory subunit, mitochondrial-like [Tigriopus californicus]
MKIDLRGSKKFNRNIADGTSKYGSGMLGLFRPANERHIVQNCIELYRELQRKGFDIGLHECGSLNLANSKDRMLSLQRRANRYKPTGLDCHVLGPNELKEKHPYLYTADLQGGVWVPDDSTVHPKKVSEALAYQAYSGGARFVGDCGVNKVTTTKCDRLGPNSSGNVRVSGVETEKGFIECDYFVNCAGIWAREIGQLSEPIVKVPVCPAEHFFLTFKEIPEMKDKQLPIVRDYDNHTYFRVWNNSFLMGTFEREARPWNVKSETGWNNVTEEHWIHMSPYISAATRRMPILKESQYDFLLNTPDAFTPDGKWILGEAPEVGNYFVCAGMNGNSLQGAGGVGKVTADWMVRKHPPGNMLSFEVQRFTNLHNNKKFLYERAFEVYPIINEFKRGRKIRTSPIFSELEARGAVFGERMGWERPLYFNPFHSRDDTPAQLPHLGTFGKPECFDQIEEEYHVCREAVGIIDMSSFSKFVINGDEHALVEYLQNLCSNNVNIPVGGIIPTGMLNEKGGFENDCMLVRKRKDSYFMVCPTQQQTRILEWMEGHLPRNSNIGLSDVTSLYTVLTLAGPKSTDLMEELTNSSMTMQPFTFKYVNMGYASGVMVQTVTQTGEPGFSLYVQSDHALHLYDRIMSVGRDYGIRNVGHLAMRFLRIEKFIPFWGEELTSESSPIEVGRTFKVKFDKDNFIGKDVLVRQRKEGVVKRLVQFQLKSFNKDTQNWPWGGEAIFRNREFVGVVTNSAYGFTLKKMVCLGFVQHPETFKGHVTRLDGNFFNDKSAEWFINVGGDMHPATCHLFPPTFQKVGTELEQMESAHNAKPPKPGHAPKMSVVQKKQK